jgi:hypothetical protein
MPVPENTRLRVWGTNASAQGFMRYFCQKVSDRFTFVETADRPDFVFFTNIDSAVLKFDGVRIFFAGENVLPDFNVADYAIAFDRMSFGDRYLRWPLLRTCESYPLLCQPRPPVGDLCRDRSEFCACVVSNMTSREGGLEAYADCFSTYRPVSYGGRWRNNVGGRVADKQAFLRKHKFSFAFENTSYPGYATEKIADAFAANTIPIYWGDPEIGQELNPAAFVNCHAFESAADVLARVQAIDADDALYRSMLAAPYLLGGQEPPSLSEARLTSFLSNIFRQPPAQAYRRPRGRWGRKYESRMKTAFFNPVGQARVLVKNALRALRGKE